MEKNPTWLCVVAGALRADDGRWLMHRRPPDKHHGGLWEWPGGKVEAGETPTMALVRELAEELGVAAHPNAVAPIAFAQESAREDGPPIVILLYTIDSWEGEARALEQGGAIAWFTPREILALDRPPLDIALCEQMFGGIASAFAAQ